MNAIRRWPCAIRCATARLGSGTVVAEHAVGVDRLRRAIDEHHGDAGRHVARQDSCGRSRWGPRSGRRRGARAPTRSARARASGSSSELPAKVTTERVRATSSTPRWMAEKNGFETSSKIRPSEADMRLARRSVPAVWLCRYPSNSTARCTFTASSGATGGLPLTTRETVLRLTPARPATSFIVARRPFGRPPSNSSGICRAALTSATVADPELRITSLGSRLSRA